MDQSKTVSADVSSQLSGPAGLVLNLDTHEVRRDGRRLCLELREFQLLEYLMRNKNRVISRDEIFQEVWGVDVVNHTLDARISALRKKIDLDYPERVLFTISRKGYLLIDHSTT
jgi:DNA-binding response OmpR family regulator